MVVHRRCSIKAGPARMALSPVAPHFTHVEVKDDPPSPCGIANGTSTKSGSSNTSTSSSSVSSSSSTEREDSAPKSPVHYKGALKAAKTDPP